MANTETFVKRLLQTLQMTSTHIEKPYWLFCHWKGGLYGWKINQDAETALFENITRGEIMKKEPIYAQIALFRGENEIGNTYLGINITKQHVWYYLDDKLVTNGPVVTGNPNRGGLP